jgi:hypothetical protein
MPCLEGAQREDHDGREAGIEVVQDRGKGGRFRPPFLLRVVAGMWRCLAFTPWMRSFEIKDLAVYSLQVFEK